MRGGRAASSTPIKSGSTGSDQIGAGRAIGMCYLYILKNEETDRYYIGSTNNLERRLKQHRSGQTRTTKILKTFTLVYKEKYDNIVEAKKREKQLKSYKSKKYIKWLINNGLGR